ncbi:hypothetical protein BST95_02100 [Halioglobus japonicus]|uniref:DUF1761 domain-containing protein n=1 Tax=Halioglobus japonicus TaxID=930805 RepID=A0AAP8MC98_9GAMM|nr:DUF1761 domain-containing protein [Halioglobus japonicus]AQA17187.1 hypothetical protein BST95_02100 [Halioglobus japonicus]PLW85101.1 DUF1761 domain-containing protein [Halioglobus japonicus]
MDFSSVDWIAVVVAAVSAFVVGGIWYGPVFGKRWQALEGLSDEDIQNSGHPAVIMGSAFVFTLVQAAALAAVMPADGGVVGGVASGAFIGVFFVASAFGINYLFSRNPRGLWGIGAGYNVAQLALMGAILGAFG